MKNNGAMSPHRESCSVARVKDGGHGGPLRLRPSGASVLFGLECGKFGKAAGVLGNVLD
jgi:hypothetical protein